MRVEVGGAAEPTEVLFDEAYYLAQFVLPPEGDVDTLLSHYLEHGWRSGIDPHPSFCTEAYLIMNPDVDLAGLNPLAHWREHGRAENRPTATVEEAATTSLSGSVTPELVGRRTSFMRYVSQLGFHVAHSDIRLRPASVDGVRRSPAWFDEDFYLGRYSDVRNIGIDPYWHFLTEGFREGRLPNRSVSLRDLVPRNDVDAVLAARTLEVHVERMTAGDDSAELVPADRLATAIAPLLQVVGGGINLSLTHDDYVDHVGGVQLCVGFEQRNTVDQGLDHVALFPLISGPLLSPRVEGTMLRGRVNGTEIPGPFTLDEFAEALAEPTLSGASVARVVVHSLFGHGPEEVREFIARTEPDRLTWWVHDYSAQCANPNLLRNGVHWCASPSLEAQCCELCAFGPHRTEHVRRVHDLLQAFDWDVVAPSQSAAESSAAGHVVLPRPVRVEPHGRLVTGDGCRMREADAPFRVAFVGHPAVAKGWMEFLRLVDELADEEIEFVHFGADNTLTEGVRFVETRQGHANFGVVTEFLSANRIDAVLNWARWRETFNFVTYEAMAAGCLIITNESSGNVVAAARQFDMALVFDSFEDVVAPGALIRALCRKLADGPPSTGRLEMAGLSAVTRGNP